MGDINRFADDLTRKLQGGRSSLAGCSRVQLMVEEISGSVMVLVRTEPSLSAKLLGAAEYQYPGECLVNMAIILGYVIEYMERGEVALAGSELAQITFAAPMAAMEMDEITGMLTVPRIAREELSSSEWGRMLFGSRFPLAGQKGAGDIELHMFYLPDTPFEELSAAERTHLVKLSAGWNIVSVHDEEYVPRMAGVIEYVSQEAQTILTR